MPESASLKDKRQVVRSVTQRVRNKFNVAIAEVDDRDAWQIATLGVACASNEQAHCEDILREVLDYVESSRPDAEVLDVVTEFVSL